MMDLFHPRDFLLLQDRPVRIPLQDWAASIANALEGLGVEVPRNYQRISAFLNLAALIEYFRGESASANMLCDAHLLWLARLMNSDADASCSVWALVFQPWVNRGRLLRLEGKLDEALECFSRVLRLDGGQPVTLGPCSITREQWCRIVDEDPAVPDTLRNIHFVESLKSYFICRRFDAALRFLSKTQRADWKADRDLLLEAEVISLYNLGDYHRVRLLTASYIGSALLSNLVFLLYRALAHRCLNQMSETRVIGHELTVCVQGFDSSEVSPALLRYVSVLASLVENLGQNDDASALYKKGHSMASALNDQPFQILYLSGLLRLASAVERADLEVERVRLVDDCYYCDHAPLGGQVRKRGHPVFDDLRSAVVRATSDDL